VSDPEYQLVVIA